MSTDLYSFVRKNGSVKRRTTGTIIAVTLATAVVGLYSCTSFSSSNKERPSFMDKNPPMVISKEPERANPEKVARVRWVGGRFRFGEPKYLFRTIDDYHEAIDVEWMERKEKLYDGWVADMNVLPFECDNGDNQTAFLAAGATRNLLRLDGTVVTVYGSLNDDCKENDMPGELDDSYAMDLVYDSYMYRLRRNSGVMVEMPDGLEKISLVDLVKDCDYEIPPHLLRTFDQEHREEALVLLEAWEAEGVSPYLQETFDCMMSVYLNEMSENGFDPVTCVPR